MLVEWKTFLTDTKNCQGNVLDHEHCPVASFRPLNVCMAHQGQDENKSITVWWKIFFKCIWNATSDQLITAFMCSNISIWCAVSGSFSETSEVLVDWKCQWRIQGVRWVQMKPPTPPRAFHHCMKLPTKLTNTVLLSSRVFAGRISPASSLDPNGGLPSQRLHAEPPPKSGIRPWMWLVFKPACLICLFTMYIKYV